MPSLVLKPSLDTFNRDEVEEFVTAIRAKRMAAAIEYFESKNQKIAHLADKQQKKFLGHLERLEKELFKLEAAEEKVLQRLALIEEVKQEFGILVEQVVDTTGEHDPNEEG